MDPANLPSISEGAKLQPEASPPITLAPQAIVHVAPGKGYMICAGRAANLL